MLSTIYHLSIASRCIYVHVILAITRSPGKAFVEGDASSASYFLAGAAITGGTVTVEGCGTSSLQVFSFNFLSHIYLIL